MTTSSVKKALAYHTGWGAQSVKGPRGSKSPLNEQNIKNHFYAFRSSDRKQYPMRLEIITLSLQGGGGHRLYATVDSSADEVIVTG
jgi:hypothetical protein